MVTSDDTVRGGNRERTTSLTAANTVAGDFASSQQTGRRCTRAVGAAVICRAL